MKHFRYVGQTGGVRSVGEISAYTPQDARAKLRSDGIAVVSLDEVETQRLRISPLNLSNTRLEILYRQLATLQKAGIALDRSFRLLGTQAETPAEGEIARGVGKALSHGADLASAMGLYPKVFGKAHVSMIQVGMATGMLGEIFDSLAKLTAQANGLQKKVVASAIYPAIVLAVAMCTVFGLFNFIVPQFLDLVKELNVQMPLLTQLIVGIAQVTRHPVTIALVVILAVLSPRIWRRFVADRQIRRLLDSNAAHIVIIGDVTRKVAVARGMQMLSALCRAGVNMGVAFELAGRACGNYLVADAMDDVAREIRLGVRVVDAMKRHRDVFTPAVLAYVEVGETTGCVPEMLIKAAEIISMDVVAMLDVLPSLLEPLIIVALGIMVGVIILAVFVPLYGALKTI